MVRAAAYCDRVWFGGFCERRRAYVDCSVCKDLVEDFRPNFRWQSKQGQVGGIDGSTGKCQLQVLLQPIERNIYRLLGDGRLVEVQQPRGALVRCSRHERVLQRPVKWDDWLHRRHNELPCKVGQKRIIEEAKPKSERLEVVKGG